MRILGFALTVCAALFLSACSAGSGTKKDGKDGKNAASNADKIVGTWEVTKGAEMVVARAVVTLDAIAMAVAVQMPSRFMQSSDAYDGSLDAPRTHQTKRSSFPVFEPTTVTNLSPEKSTPIASVGSSTLDVFDQ